MRQVCIQGLGFVGAAMAVAVASARTSEGNVIYQVTGVEQNTQQGIERVDAINQGIFPFANADESLCEALVRANEAGNLSATTDESVYRSADVVVIDIGFDIHFLDQNPDLNMSPLEDAVRSIARFIPKGGLVLVETTVPPGTCEKLVGPILKEELAKRGLSEDSIYLAHSFERVMPGKMYLESIAQFWRAYAGETDAAADVCENFLSSFVDVQNFPLTRLSSMTASETVKVMENTYRAVNIAFIDEWTKYAEKVGIDLYEVVDAIKLRPTHSNIRFPGLGVGGYCLTKDPAFAPAAARQLFGIEELDFPFSTLAMRVNQAMPFHTVERLNQILGGSMSEKSILILGVSYRQDIGDTRYSPVETLVRLLEERGARVTGYDPYLDYWEEMERSLPKTLPKANTFHMVFIAVPHQEFFDLDILSWLDDRRPIVFDSANVISPTDRQRYRIAGVRVESIGRGDSM